MSDRYMVIHPDTLEAMRRAGHVAKLEARIEKLEAALLWYAEHCQKGGDDIEGPYGDYGQRARKALEGKENE